MIDLISFEISDELFKIKENYYNSKDITSYISNCSNLFIKAFKQSKKYQSKQILYFNLFGYDYNQNNFVSLVKYVPTFYKANNFETKIVECYKIGTQCIENNKMLSISARIVENKTNFIFLSNDTKEIEKLKKEVSSIPVFDLNDYNANFETPNNLDDYCNIQNDHFDKFKIKQFAKALSIKVSNKKEFSKLLVNLRVQKITYSSIKKTYIYYIRPRVFHKEFIGSFYLVLEFPLAIEHLNQLSNFALDVFSETAISRIRKFEKSEILNNLNKELSHTWNNYFESIKNIVKDRIIPPAYNGNIVELRKVKDSLLTKISTTAEIHKFFTYVHKAGDNLENTEISNDIKDAISKSNFNINASIKSTLEILLNYFDDSTGNYLIETNNIQKCLDDNKRNEKKQEVYSSKIAIEIVLFNLIKNAIIHSAIKEKPIKIKTSTDKHYTNIEVTNSGVLHNNWINFINQNESFESPNIKNMNFSYGIRTVKRILEIEYLKNNGKEIVLNAVVNSKRNETLMTLKIPHYNEK